MRVTNRMLAYTSMRDMQTSLQKLEKYQKELSSGRKINAPSDDPVGTSKALTYRTTLNKIEQYQKNISDAKEIGALGDSNLGDINNLIAHMREIAVRGASSTLSATEKKALSKEVEETIGHIVRLGNASDGNKYIFAGTKNADKPFSIKNGVVYYEGNQESIISQLDEGVQDAVSLPGSELIMSDVTAKTKVANIKKPLNTLSLYPPLQAGSFYVNGAKIDIDPSADSLLDVANRITHTPDAYAYAEVTSDNQIKITSLKADGKFDISAGDSNFVFAMGLVPHIKGDQIASKNAPLTLLSNFNNDSYNLLNGDVQLKRLNNGSGITIPPPANSFTITDSDGDSISVDLSSLDENSTLSDFQSAVDNAVANASPNFNVDRIYVQYKDDSIVLRPSSDQITISEGAGSTASELGIAGITGTRNVPAVGSGLSPDLGIPVDKKITKLRDFFNGGGISMPLGTITLADGSGNSIDVDLSSLSGNSTIEDIENKINQSIISAKNDNSDPNYPTTMDFSHIDISLDWDMLHITVPNGQVNISDSSGTTATDLGMATGGLVSDYHSNLALDPQMRGLSITKILDDQTELNSIIDLNGVHTVGDLIDKINNNAYTDDGKALNIKAFLSEDGTSIELFSTSNDGKILTSDFEDKGASLLKIDKEADKNENVGILDTLYRLKEYLNDDNSDAASKAIEFVDTAQTKLLDGRSKLGARLNRAEMIENRLLKSTGEITKLLSETEDIDFEKVVVDYSMAQQIYESTLRAAAKSMPMSLVNFL